MLRKFVYLLVVFFTIVVVGCESGALPLTDRDRGYSEGRAMVRQMRKEGAGWELQLYPIQGGSAPQYSAEYQAGYRKGYTDELKQP
jgi:uncharacterized protein YceK